MNRTPSLRDVARMAAPNLVILPTAQRTQVKQQPTAAARAERARIKAETQWPADRYAHPHTRRARKTAKALAEVGRTPELLLLLAILDTMPRDQRQGIADKLAPLAGPGSTADVALEVVRATMLTLGEAYDLSRAQRELAEGRA